MVCARTQAELGRDAATILELKPALTTFLHAFDGCFGRRTTRRYLSVYVTGQLSDLDRKRVEPLADAAGVPPRWQVPHPPACAVRALRQPSPVLRRIPWPTYRVPAGTPGPFEWPAQCVPLWITDERGRHPQPSQATAAAIVGDRDTVTRPMHLSVAEKVAL